MIKAFYSDPHLFHEGIIRYCERPFKDAAEMNEELVRRYNEVINVDDTVMWCGDCSFGTKDETKEILKRFNGRKVLVKGNHDRPDGAMAEIGFDIVMKEAMVLIAGRRCRVSHYPYAGTPHDDRTVDTRYLDRRPAKIKHEILIHGHIHSKHKVNSNQIHVGVDAWDFRPATLTEIEDIVKGIK